MKKVFLFLIILLLFVTCSEKDKTVEKQEEIEIALVSNAVVPFWTAMAKGMEHAGEKLGVKVSWKGPESSQVSEQMRIIENFVSKGVDGISISPINPESIIPVINSIVDKNIIVLTMDSDSPESGRFAYIGTNNYKAGIEAVRLASPLFIIPLLFIYTPILLDGPVANVIETMLSCLIGIIAYAGMMQGYWIKRTNWLERILLGVAALCLFIPNIFSDIGGVLLLILISSYNRKKVEVTTVLPGQDMANEKVA